MRSERKEGEVNKDQEKGKKKEGEARRAVYGCEDEIQI